MPKLYDLTGSVLKLHDQLEELGDLDQQTIIDTLESSQEYMNFEEKAVNVARFIKNIKGDIPAIEAEIKRLQAMKTAKENVVKHATTYLQTQMETSGITKVKRDMFNIYIQANRPSLVLEENIIPLGYTKMEQTRVIDKDAIVTALDAGEIIAGAYYNQGKSLRIR